MSSSGGDISEPDPRDERPRRRLSNDEATQLAGHLAELTSARLPVGPGLRAAAAELPSGRLAQTIERVANELEQGQPLEQTLTNNQQQFPAYLSGLIAAGIRAGNLGAVLERFVCFRRFTSDIRRKVGLTLAYPLLLMALIVGLFLLLLFGAVPKLIMIEQEFGPKIYRSNGSSQYQLSENIRVLQWWSTNINVWLPVLIAVAILLVICGCLAGKARVRWVLNRLPGFGHLGRYGGLAEWCELLRLLVESEIPLPEALRLAAAGVGDAEVAEGSRRLAERVEAGQTLADALQQLPHFTPLMPSLIAWGENSGSLPTALDASAQLCLRRVELRADLVRGIVPPIAFLIVGAGVLFVWSFFSILISLIRSLSGSGDEPIGLQADGVVSLALLGTAILISVRLVYSGRTAAYDILHGLMQMTGWLLIAAAVMGFFLVAAGGLGAWLCLFALVVWGMAVYRMRRTQQAALQNLLSIALRRELPLQRMVVAFAQHEPGVVGRRANLFAARLVAGQPLAQAARQTRRLLPPQAILALELGKSTHQTAELLEQATIARLAPPGGKTNMAGAAVSLFALSTSGVFAVIFTAMKIAPAFEFIFKKDFHIPLPRVTQALFEITRSPQAIAILASFAVISIGLGFYTALYELGWLRFGLPIVDRLLAARHSAVILRWLATAVRCGLPLEPTIDLLSSRYPKQLIRSRLRRALIEMKLGSDWITSLRSSRLIRRIDAALLSAATRAGNVPWALEEAAAGALRRLTYRMQAMSQIFVPLLIIFVGGLVLVFAVGYLLPLAELIDVLAKRV